MLNNQTSDKTKKGFTLIELLVVISIIAILSIIGMTLYANVQQRAADAKRKADVEAISKAFELHYSASAGSYTQPIDDWFGSGGIPKDPRNDDTYYYRWNGGAKDVLPTASNPTYTICAKLKNCIGSNCGGNSFDKGDGVTFTYVSTNDDQYFCRKNLQ